MMHYATWLGNLDDAFCGLLGNFDDAVLWYVNKIRWCYGLYSKLLDGALCGLGNLDDSMMHYGYLVVVL